MKLPTSRRLLVGAATLLALLTACRARPVTECPQKEGYDSMPGTAYNPASLSNVKTFPSLAAAEAACNSDPRCISFNSDGQVMTAHSDSWGRDFHGCSYIKAACPRKSGFTMYDKFEIIGDSSFNAGSAAAAEAACSTPGSNCTAWTTGGLVFTSSSISRSYTPSPYCAYVIAPCSATFGFEAGMNLNLEGPSGVSGTSKGTMGSALEAEAFCKITPKCSAWNSKGEYFIGGIKNVISDASVACVHAKLPCPPVVGFTSYYGFAVDRGAHGAPVATESALCFADIKDKCTADANCKLFDMMRNIWHSDSEPLTPFPGMCTYRKIPGI